MNIDEVIKILRNEQACVKTADSCDRDCAKCPLIIGSDEIIEAYEIAIKLLLQLTRIDEVRTQMSSADCISRHEAIDAVEHITSSMSVCVNSDECHWMKRMQRQAVIELTNLPSAQPQKKELSEWQEDFRGYINLLNLQRDDYNGIMEYIDEAPSAHPEIIYCKDCKHYNAGFECLIEGYGIERNKDWFCADAERRTDG